jgi:hypothetical protein
MENNLHQQALVTLWLGNGSCGNSCIDNFLLNRRTAITLHPFANSWLSKYNLQKGSNIITVAVKYVENALKILPRV